jgi:hypothetical protein
MTDTPSPKTVYPEPASPEQARPQAQEDPAGPSGPQAEHSQSGQRATPGRRPLFRN